MKEKIIGGKTIAEIKAMVKADTREFQDWRDSLSKEDTKIYLKELRNETYWIDIADSLFIEQKSLPWILSAIGCAYFLFKYLNPYMSDNPFFLNAYNILEINFFVYWVIGGVLTYLIFYFDNGYYKSKYNRPHSGAVQDENWYKYIAMPILLLTFGWVGFTFFLIFFIIYRISRLILFMIGKLLKLIIGPVKRELYKAPKRN